MSGFFYLWQNQKVMKKLLLPFLLLAVVSCSNPMNKKYDEKTLEADMKEIKEKNKLSEEDTKTFAGWLLLSKLANKDLTGKTYQQILDEAKNYKKEQEELAAKAKAEEKAKAEKMKNAATVTIYDYAYHPANMDNYELQDSHIFKYAIQNKSNKEIKALKFHFRIYNSLGDELGDGYEMSLTDDRIAPLATYKNAASFDANKYNNADNKIANSKFSDLKFDIAVDKIVYSDDTTLE